MLMNGNIDKIFNIRISHMECDFLHDLIEGIITIKDVKQNVLSEIKKQQEESLNNFEKLKTQYLEEIKEDNPNVVGIRINYCNNTVELFMGD